MGARRKKCWSYVAGERGRNWVRAFEKEKGGVLFVEWYEEGALGTPPRRKRASLGHRDRDQAKAAADEIAAAFAAGVESGSQPDAPLEPTIHELLDSYLASETRYKSPSKQGHDRRAASTFKVFFTPTRRADSLNLGDWNGFIRARREGQVGPPSTVRRAKRLEDADLPFPAVGDRQIERSNTTSAFSGRC